MRTPMLSSRRLGLAGLALALGSGSAFAQEATCPSSCSALGGGVLQLLVAIIQLMVALSIAAFAIKKGFDLLAKLLNRSGKGFDIWQEIRNKNVAVAVMGACVIISYCNVIGSGIDSMSNVLGSITSQTMWQSLMGLVSAIVNLIVAIAVASFAITVVFRVMDRLTTNIDEVAELKSNNVAIGVVYGGLIIGVSFLVSSGVTSIGMGVNAVLEAILRMVGLV